MNLIINTSNFNNFVAVALGDQVIGFLEWTVENKQSEVLLPKINELFDSLDKAKEDLKKIIVISGPGSYTGIRVSISIANSLSYSLKIPVGELNWLEIIQKFSAKECVRDSFVSLIPSIADKYYYGIFQNNKLIEYGNKILSDIERTDEFCVAGRLNETDKDKMTNFIDISGLGVLEFLNIITKEIKSLEDIKIAKPFYINMPNITLPKKR